MRWNHVWENDNITVKEDNFDKSVIFETNSGGLIPTYVTLHLTKNEIEELIGALMSVKRNLLRTEYPL